MNSFRSFAATLGDDQQRAACDWGDRLEIIFNIERKLEDSAIPFSG
jgi:hypothetical protein